MVSSDQLQDWVRRAAGNAEVACWGYSVVWCWWREGEGTHKIILVDDMKYTSTEKNTWLVAGSELILHYSFAQGNKKI